MPRSDGRSTSQFPLNAEQLIRGKDSAIDGGRAWLSFMVRLKPGQSAEAATSLLRSVQPQIREAVSPNTAAGGPGPGVSPTRRSSLSQEPIHARARVAGHIATASTIRAAPARDPGHRRAGPPDRLRQHRQPAPRAGDRAPARIERAAGAGSDALASRAAACSLKRSCSPASARWPDSCLRGGRAPCWWRSCRPQSRG